MEKIAIEYGDGLFDLACEEGIEKELLTQTRALKSLLRSEPSYTRLMSSRSVKKEEKDLLLKQAFEGRLHRYLYNFLRLMNDRDYFSYVPACCSRYEDRYYLDNGLKKVTVRSASPLTDDQKARVKESVEKKLGIKAETEYICDPSLIAGLRIEAEGVMIENSAKSRLEDLKRHLSTAVTGNN